MAKAAETQALWGAETEKAIANFPVSGEPIPIPVARWLGRIKAAAARANADLELLDRELADRIAAAGDRIAAGEFDDQFPIDVFQTGSGTSSNMNANEVMATLAGEGVHPNDHVNMGQSSNDVFPSAVHLAALGELANDLLPALERARRSARAEGRRVRRRGEVGPNASHGCRARDARPGVRRLRRADPARNRTGRGRDAAPRPDPARRHRDGDRPEHARRVRCARARLPLRGHRADDLGPGRSLRGAGSSRRPRRGLGRAEGRRRLAHEDRERSAADGLGAARGPLRDLPP